MSVAPDWYSPMILQTVTKVTLVKMSDPGKGLGRKYWTGWRDPVDNEHHRSVH
jgi:hypothetical protein